MVTKADTARVKELVEAGAQLVDVLPRNTFLEEHLPGAVNVPLAEIASASDELDRERPVVVYCYDYQCDLSARGAASLEQLGFDKVYDYVASKAAWLADGLPGAGRLHDDERAGASVLADLPVLAPAATVADLREEIGDWELAAVVDDSRVVLGVVRAEAVEAPDDMQLARIMQTAPPTVRPSISLRELATSMEKNGEQHVLVTTLDGMLLGLIRRDDLARG
jgi:rhodanese-related sulfurtransferase